LDALGLLTIFAVLLGTVGGLGSIFNLLVTPWIRGYNRIGIFIAFFSLAALLLLLDRIPLKRLFLWGLAAGLVVLGIYDQTSTGMIPRYRSLKREYENDAAFVREIEDGLPAHSRIWQIPEMVYPEDEPFTAWGTSITSWVTFTRARCTGVSA